MTGPEMLALKQLIDQARRAQLKRTSWQVDKSLDGTYRRKHRLMSPRPTFAQRGLDRDLLRDRVLALAADGLSVRQIAAATGVSKSQVHNWKTTATGPEVLDGLDGASRRTECTA